MIVEVLGLYLNTGFGLSGKPSGTTATIVVVDGWTVTVACVGDSRCILDSQGVVTNLTQIGYQSRGVSAIYGHIFYFQLLFTSTTSNGIFFPSSNLFFCLLLLVFCCTIMMGCCKCFLVAALLLESCPHIVCELLPGRSDLKHVESK